MKSLPCTARIVSSVLAIITALCCGACTAEQGALWENVRLRSKSAFVYDLNTEEASFAGDIKVYPASTTKLLTALCALSIMNPDEEVSPGEEVYMTGEGASSAYIRPGHVLSVEMLIEAMMIPSGNDAAYALAAACGKKLLSDDGAGAEESVFRFVDEMNEYAKTELGCTESNFTTPDGLAGEEHYSTAKDMAKISAAATKNDIIMKYAGCAFDDVQYASGHVNHWDNTNKQLDEASPFYDENIKGMKTGSLDKYYCLITLYDNGESRYIIGVFGSPTDVGRYKDVKNILENILKQ